MKPGTAASFSVSWSLALSRRVAPVLPGRIRPRAAESGHYRPRSEQLQVAMECSPDTGSCRHAGAARMSVSNCNSESGSGTAPTVPDSSDDRSHKCDAQRWAAPKAPEKLITWRIGYTRITNNGLEFGQFSFRALLARELGVCPYSAAVLSVDWRFDNGAGLRWSATSDIARSVWNCWASRTFPAVASRCVSSPLTAFEKGG